MRINVRVLASIGAGLALGLGLLAVANTGWADGEKEAAADVLKLADALEKGDADAIKKAKDVANKHELLPLMAGFKKRDATPPGIGFGSKPGAVTPDGIEAQIMGMAKKEMPAANLAKLKDDIARAAKVSEALAETTYDKGPKKKMGDKDPAEWKKFTDDMKNASKALGDAAKKADTKGVKDAASKLNASCNNCHGVFRDS